MGDASDISEVYLMIMSLITTLTRSWLTRSARPFVFLNEYDDRLSYANCDKLGLYVHIPFCRSICNFCPYCKVKYDSRLCDTGCQLAEPGSLSARKQHRNAFLLFHGKNLLYLHEYNQYA